MNQTANGNQEPNTTENEISLLHEQPYLAAVLIIFYVVIFMVGMFGNLMVVYVVIKYKALQTITNRFIACLSVSDILICLFAIPFTPINAFVVSWPLGELLCKVVPMVLMTSVFVSTLTSVAIAVDRYVVIIYPYYPRMTDKKQAIVIFSIWIISISSSIPVATFTFLKTEGTGHSCEEDWPTEHGNTIFTWFVLSVQLIIPAIVITFCYTAISIRLCKKAEVKLGTRVEAKMKVDARRNKRINKMLIAMVTIFVCCWLPLDLYHFFAQEISDEYSIHVFLAFHVIAMSSVMYNPFLYGWMNGNFNLYFKRVLPCLKRLPKVERESENDSYLTNNATYNCSGFSTEELSSRNLIHADNPKNGYRTVVEKTQNGSTAVHLLPRNDFGTISV